MTTISKKICLIGDFGVGKTSLIRRFVEGQFSDKYLSTVGVKISRKMIEIQGVNNQEITNVQLLIWDIEGSTKFKAIAPSYLQGASGAVVVADFSRQETLDHIADHIQLFLSVNPKGSIITALNKSDLLDEDKINKVMLSYQFEDIKEVLSTYPTSAKTGAHVEQIFAELAYKIV